MISRIANLVGNLEGLSLLFTVIAGVGLLGYVGFTWLIYLVGQGQYLIAVSISLLSLPLVAGAFLRIPIAQIVVFGCAVICGTAFLMGYGNVLLP